MSVFLDSNVWIYLFSKQDNNKYKIAKDLVKSGNIVSSVQSVNETCWNLIHKFKYSEKKVKLVIKHFARLPIHTVGTHLLWSASSLRSHYQLSFWDSLLIATAKDAGCSVFYSEDLHDGLDVDGLVIVNPFKEDKSSGGK